MMPSTSTAALFSVLLSLPSTLAHSWVEQLMVIASNGSMIGTPGYVRGQVSRDNNFSDGSMDYLIPPNGRSTGNEILPSDLICKNTQTIGNYSSDFPALVASPGDNIALRYQENGHVTQPSIPPGKPAHSGTVYVYGTTEPSNNDTLMAIHQVWNADGTGGDGRGVLLATRPFDDGQCYQVNPSNISVERQAEFPHTADQLMGVNIWCQTDVQIPASVNADNYTLYWVWDWPTAPSDGNPNGTQEIYTTCMDVVMDESSSSGSKAAQNVKFVEGQDWNYAAAAPQLTNQYLVTGTATANNINNLAGATGAASETVTIVPPTASVSAETVTTSAMATSTADPVAASSELAVSSSSDEAGDHTVTVTDATTQYITVTQVVTETAGASSSGTAAQSPNTAVSASPSSANTTTTFYKPTITLSTSGTVKAFASSKTESESATESAKASATGAMFSQGTAVNSGKSSATATQLLSNTYAVTGGATGGADSATGAATASATASASASTSGSASPSPSSTETASASGTASASTSTLSLTLSASNGAAPQRQHISYSTLHVPDAKTSTSTLLVPSTTTLITSATAGPSVTRSFPSTDSTTYSVATTTSLLPGQSGSGGGNGTVSRIKRHVLGHGRGF